MKTLAIQKKDTDVVVIEKIARKAVSAALKELAEKQGSRDPTGYSYGTNGGSFGTGGGTGSVYTIQFKMFGVTATPTVATFATRQKLQAEGGVHLYDYDATNSIAQIRLNPVNNPMIAFALL